MVGPGLAVGLAVALVGAVVVGLVGVAAEAWVEAAGSVAGSERAVEPVPVVGPALAAEVDSEVVVVEGLVEEEEPVVGLAEELVVDLVVGFPDL